MAWEVEIKQERRLCAVNWETGYFHTWEHYTTLSGQNGVYGLVEFEDGVRRVDPMLIKFHDEENEMLSVFNKKENDMCEYCEGGKPLEIGKTNDQGIAIQYPNRLIAYGYDIHGSGSNGLVTRINYCPMCGKQLKGDSND